MRRRVQKCDQVFHRQVRRVLLKEKAEERHLVPRVFSGLIIRAGQCAELAGISHAAQIDLRFSDSACELFGFRVGARAGDLARKRFHLL